MKRTSIILFVILIVIIFIIIGNNLYADKEDVEKVLRIGYQRFTRELENKEYVYSFIQYLQKEFPEYRIDVSCHSDDSLIHALCWGELDFAICDPYIAVVAEHVNSYTLSATLVRQGPIGFVKHQAGAIFCKSDREDIINLQDVVGKTVVIPRYKCFTGWILPLFEFKKHDIDLLRDFRSIHTAGSYDGVVKEVMEGDADVGFISAYYLWKFIEEGKCKENEIKIINRRESKDVPYPHSTDVFPEVCCVIHSSLSEEIKKRMLLALFKIPSESDEARCFDAVGWIPPLSYTSVEELVRKLRLFPFEETGKETVLEFIQREKYFVGFFLIFWTSLIVIVISFIYIYRIIQANKILGKLLQETKLTKKDLEESERRYKLLAENFPGAVYICKNDKYYTMLYLTDGVFHITGYTKEEFLSTRINFPDIYHPEDRDYIYNEVDTQLSKRAPYHLFYRVQHRDGQWVWIEEIGTGVWDDDNLLYLQGYLWDITQKKQEEEREREKKERLILEKDIITSIVINPFLEEGNFEGLSKFVTEEVGKKLKVPRVNVWLFNDDRTQLECVDHYDFSSGLHSSGYILHEEEFFSEFQELKTSKYVDAYDAIEDPRTKGYASNYLIPLNIKSMLDVGIRIGEKNVGVICFEYTEQKHAWDDDEIAFACQVADQLALTLIHQEKIKSEQQKRLLIQTVESTEEGILITDVDGKIVYVNNAVERITGINSQEIVSTSLLFFFESKMNREEYLDVIKKVKEGQTVRGQLEWARGDKDKYTIDYSVFPLLDENKRITNIVVIFRDITREIKLLNDLKQAQKMESIGQLAGGIAHDLNNHLMVINGYAELAERELNVTSPVLPYIQEIIKANQKASILIRQLLAFARRQILKRESVNVNELVREIYKMLERLLRENIELTFYPDSSIPMILADKNAVEIVLINLCVNANDAMPNGGKLIIETGMNFISEERVKGIPWAKAGNFVVISVTDTGIGMDKYTLEHCFDPFFTTKETGRGTGLGLSTVYGIVQQHGGIIHVYSEVGKGTSFKVYLPAVNQEQMQNGEEITFRHIEQLVGNETILLAEDELSVRAVTARILEGAGYRVISAKDGKEAYQLFLENINNIDLVILDVIMPVMGGKELYDRIKEIKPEVPVLFSTGYSENSIHTNFILEENINLINKPYGRYEFLRAVRDVLDKSKGT